MVRCVKPGRISCDIVLDTSIAWAMVDSPLERPIRAFTGNLASTGRRICYTEHVLFEFATVGYTGFRVRSILSSMASCIHTGLTPLTARRYKAYGRLGANDILIAVSARNLNSILFTGDWSMAKFYMDLTGKKPIFIPRRHLE